MRQNLRWQGDEDKQKFITDDHANDA